MGNKNRSDRFLHSHMADNTSGMAGKPRIEGAGLRKIDLMKSLLRAVNECYIEG